MKQLLFLLAILPNLLFSQAKTDSLKRFEMGVFIAPHLNSTLTSSDESYFRFSRLSFGASVGLIFRFRFAKKWWFRSNLQFNFDNYEQQNRLNIETFDKPPPPTTTVLADFKAKYLSLEIPWLIEFRLKNHWFVGVGSSFCRKLAYSATAKINYAAPKTEPDNWAADKSSVFSPSVSRNLIFTSGYIFRLKNGVSAAVAPIFKLNSDEFEQAAFLYDLSQIFSTGIQAQFFF